MLPLAAVDRICCLRHAFTQYLRMRGAARSSPLRISQHRILSPVVRQHGTASMPPLFLVLRCPPSHCILLTPSHTHSFCTSVHSAPCMFCVWTSPQSHLLHPYSFTLRGCYISLSPILHWCALYLSDPLGTVFCATRAHCACPHTPPFFALRCLVNTSTLPCLHHVPRTFTTHTHIYQKRTVAYLILVVRDLHFVA